MVEGDVITGAQDVAEAAAAEALSQAAESLATETLAREAAKEAISDAERWE